MNLRFIVAPSFSDLFNNYIGLLRYSCDVIAASPPINVLGRSNHPSCVSNPTRYNLRIVVGCSVVITVLGIHLLVYVFITPNIINSHLSFSGWGRLYIQPLLDNSRFAIFFVYTPSEINQLCLACFLSWASLHLSSYCIVISMTMILFVSGERL